MTDISVETPYTLPVWDAHKFTVFAAAELDATPEELSQSENLVALGLASVSLMRLRTRLQQDGIDISFSALAEAGSIEGWTTLVAGAQQIQQHKEQVVVQPAVEDGTPFALTHVQRAYWLGRSPQIELGGVAAHGYLEIESGGLDPDRLEVALNHIIAINPMLRAVITTDGEQRILPQVPHYDIVCNDQSGATPDVAGHEVTETRSAMRQQVLAFDSWPMFEIKLTRLPQNQWVLHVSFDILLFDIKSLEIWVAQWWQAYDQPENLPSAPDGTFRAHVARLEAGQDTPQMQRAAAYWDARVSELPLGPDLPLEKSVSKLSGMYFDRVQTKLNAAEWTTVQKIANQYGLTGSAFLMALYARSLAVWAATPHFCLTVTLFSRDAAGSDMADVIGDFTSLLPLEIDCAASSTMEMLAKAVQKQLWQDLDHNALSGIEVLAKLSAREQTHGRALLPYVFTSGLGTGRSYLDAFGAFGQITDAAVQTPQLLIDHQALECDGGLVLNWDYVKEAFASDQIDAIAQTHINWLRQLTSKERWSDPELFHDRPSADVISVPVTWHANQAQKPLFAPFQDRAQETPDHIAVVSGERAITYHELDQASTHLAHALLAQGVLPEELVAVHMQKGWQQIVAVLGVLKAGGAYMPIDPALPTARARALIEQGHSRILLASDTPVVISQDLTTIMIDDAWLSLGDAADLDLKMDPKSLAYVLFTSGTTGTPKGVMIEHQAALNTILAVNARNAVGVDDRTLMVSALHFDLSVYDVFGTLAAGGTLVIPENELEPAPRAWCTLIKRHGVSVWNSVPALLTLLVDELEQQGNLADLRALRTVFLSGDWLPVPLCRKVKEVAPNIDLISMGGPTEGSIWQVDFPVTHIDPAWRSIPYGLPLANHKVLICDHTLQPRPVGVPGEIYVGGAGLARGYWDDPRLTAKSFVVHPDTGERLYRSGDWARWHQDGWIEFLGRADSQVKLNGLRLELGEVEVALTAYPGIQKGAAIVLDGAASGKCLAAFFTTGKECVDIDALRGWLLERLPKAFVPTHLEALPSLPLTGNGKIDRKVLYKRAKDMVSNRPARVMQGAEADVLGVWSDLLSEQITDPDLNFFTIGGSSLLATQLAARLNKITEKTVQAIHIFEFPTAAQQANMLSGSKATASAAHTATDAKSRRKKQSALAVRRQRPRPHAADA